MSGLFTHRVNRYWDKSQANISAAVFFWEWLNYIDDHVGMTWIAYGTGKTQTGTTPPAGWISWDPTVDAVPWGDNSWVVFEATNADPQLDGGGGMPWQMKLQVTHATGFDDCNVADTDYGLEAKTYIVGGRVCPVGGWDSTPLDFNPAGGEEASDNFYIYGYTSGGYGQNEYFNLEIVGDDDTIFWIGSAHDGSTDQRTQSRGGYVGMIQRRSSSITYPFYYTAGHIADYASGSINRKTSVTNANWLYGDDYHWPNYSLWKDKTKVSNHSYDTWENSNFNKIQTHVESGNSVILSCGLAQWEAPQKYAIIGEFRLIGACGTDWGEHEVRGTDPQYMSFCYMPSPDVGMAMRWPVGEVPIW